MSAKSTRSSATSLLSPTKNIAPHTARGNSQQSMAVGGFASREDMISHFEKEKVTPNFEPLSDYMFISGCLEMNDVDLWEHFSKELKVTDYLVKLRSSILLDWLCNVIAFCKEHSFSTRQTLELVKLMETLRKGILNAENNTATFPTEVEMQEFARKTLFEMSMPLSPEVLMEIDKQMADEEKKLEEEKAKQEKDKKKKPTSSASTKKKLSKEEEEEEKRRIEEEQQQALERTRIEKQRRDEYRSKIPLFNIDDVAIIIDFVLKTVVQHYSLYKYVFEEEQPLTESLYQVDVDSIMLECVYPLSSMLQEASYKQKKEDEKKAREELEHKKREEADQERIRQENEAKERYEREKAERNTPKLTDESLREIAEYLKHEVMTSIEEKVSLVEGKVKATEDLTQNTLNSPKPVGNPTSRPQSRTK